MKRQIKSILLLSMMVFMLSGCGSDTSSNKETTEKVTTEATTKATTEQKTTKKTTKTTEKKKEKVAIPNAESVVKPSFPKYSGSAYVAINDNEPSFSAKEKKNKSAFENYSNLDDLGRCGVAYANICKSIMPTEKRGAIGMIKPSGWKTIKYDFVDGKYLFNRCHLIGFQLAGENANDKNLITGTRSLNIDGMLPFENMVADYVKETGGHVLYRVTPIFSGDNLVANGVQMEGWSVEDHGKSICFNVYAYNVEPGVSIDYKDGSSKATNGEQGSESKSKTNYSTYRKKQSTTSQKQSSSSKKQQFVINVNTKKFHVTSCHSLKQMNESNKKYEKGTREQLINEGYEPCKNCNP